MTAKELDPLYIWQQPSHLQTQVSTLWAEEKTWWLSHLRSESWETVHGNDCHERSDTTFEQTFNLGSPGIRHDSKENNWSACEDQTQSGNSYG